MMFCWIISNDVFTLFPSNIFHILALLVPVPQLVEPHIHCFATFLFYSSNSMPVVVLLTVLSFAGGYDGPLLQCMS